MIDHVSLAVSDLARSISFYEHVLGPLGFNLLVEREGSVAFGTRYPQVWLNERKGMQPVDQDTGVHICLRCRTKDGVDAFHAAALSHGGADAGKPGPRQAAMTEYYGAFVFDPDGNKLEAASFPAS